jgi:hypothetical protein
MAVHTISLFGAIVVVLLAVLFLVVLGPLGLLVLILAAVLFWYALGPGARGSVVVTTPWTAPDPHGNPFHATFSSLRRLLPEDGCRSDATGRKGPTPAIYAGRTESAPRGDLSMSAEGAARSIVSIILLLIGLVLLVFAAVDFLEGFGLLYCLLLLIFGVVFLVISRNV